MIKRLPLLAFLILSLPLAAQPVKDSVTIEVVDVPVFVTRADGAVKNLTQEDFELYVNGKLQPIEYFDLVGGEGVHPDQQSLRERRLFVVMFDIAFSQPHTLGRAQKAAGELIDKASPSDLFAIATYSTRRGVWFATPFTSDRVALARGISSLSDSSSGDPLSIVLTPDERQAMRDWALDRADGVDGFTRASLIDRLGGDAMRDVWQMELRRAIDDQILGFKQLSERLGTLQGQKHVIVLSEGFDTGNLQGRVDVQHARLGLDDFAGIRTRTLSTSYSPAFRYLKEMNDAFQANDILLHTLDLKGVHPMPGNDALGVLAYGTGGKFVHNRNDLGDALVDLTESFSTGYVLGFKPAHAKRGQNKIEVKVKDLPRGTDVRYRRGFSGTPQRVDTNEGLYLADVILNDVPQTGTAPVLSVDGRQLKVSVPLRPLAAQLGMSGKAELMVYVFGANGVALGFQRVTVDVASDATGEKTYAVDLPEGAKVAKAVLRVDDSLGFVKTEL